MPPSCSPDTILRLLPAAGFAAAVLVGIACPAWAQDGVASIRTEQAALWHVAMAIPDGPDREFHFRDVRVHDDGALPGGRGPLVCGALEFEDADAGVVQFALLYGRDADGRLQAGTPFFYGRNWLLGTAELADSCAAVGDARSDAGHPPR